MVQRKTCIGCNQTLEITEMATLIVCKACMQAFTPEQKEQFTRIAKKGLPGQIVGMVFMFIAMGFFIMDMFTVFNITYTLLGAVCMMIGSIVNMSVANAVKSQQKEFIAKIRQTTNTGQQTAALQ